MTRYDLVDMYDAYEEYVAERGDGKLDFHNFIQWLRRPENTYPDDDYQSYDDEYGTFE